MDPHQGHEPGGGSAGLRPSAFPGFRYEHAGSEIGAPVPGSSGVSNAPGQSINHAVIAVDPRLEKLASQFTSAEVPVSAVLGIVFLTDQSNTAAIINAHDGEPPQQTFAI